MSPIDAVLLWCVLAVLVGIAAVVAGVFGNLYGRLARGWSDESAARGTTVIVFGTAIIAAIGVWGVVDGTVPIPSIFTPARHVLSALIAAGAGGLSAALVGTAAVTGVVNTYPDLPGVDDPAATRRHYFRYLTVLLSVVLFLISLAEPAFRSGWLGIGGFFVVVVFLLWTAAPVLGTAMSNTRRPTDAEAERLEPLLDAAGIAVRGIRVVDADRRHVSINVIGAPGGRYLFVSRAALDRFEDETLLALFVARRAQVTHYATLVTGAALIGPLLLLLVAVETGLSVLIMLVPAAGLAFGGFAAARRFRYYVDDHAAAEIGSDELADAFERAAEEAGLELEDDPGRNWFSTSPPLASRIERLRLKAT
ncbi:hypothetical protein [Halopiger djelfimassiliensis]|uniref:hypothetical protein n=1 Tax=Halopiger djelfimassiliensis TaxID=1293047 RepID=UPI0006780BA1|nr:hypothetical protein [Halopiger djelfimassiliensis]